MLKYLSLVAVALLANLSSLADEKPNSTAPEASFESPLPKVAPAEVGMSVEKLGLIQPAVEALIDANKIPGAVVVVARHGKIAYFRAFGWKNIEAREPMQPDTIFRFHSMTKPITSVAVMMLIEEGRFGLDDPVERHIPEFEDLKVYGQSDGVRTRAMTVRDLLRHTSGLTSGYFGDTEVSMLYREMEVLSPTESLAWTIERLGQIPLLYTPGVKFHYSVSADVLGHLNEVKSGQSLDRFFAERIFEPLGMVDTAYFVPKEKASRLSHTYGPGEHGLVVVDNANSSSYLEPPTLLRGGGGLVGTASDVIRFCQMMLNRGELNGQRLLQPETVAEMTKNQLPEGAYPIELGGRRDGVGFGLGFSVVVEPSTFSVGSQVGEYGWGGAASTHLWISPRDDLAVVALTQHLPLDRALEHTVRPLIYDAITK